MLLIRIVLVILLVLQNIYSMPQISSIQTDFVKVVTAIKSLQSERSTDEISAIIALGLVEGTLDVKKYLEDKMSNLLKNILLNSNTTDVMEILEKGKDLKSILVRDKIVLEALSSILDLLSNSTNVEQFKVSMEELVKEAESNYNRNPLINRTEANTHTLINQYKGDILDFVDSMLVLVSNKANKTALYVLENLKAINSSLLHMKSLDSMESTTTRAVELLRGNYKEDANEANDIEETHKAIDKQNKIVESTTLVSDVDFDDLEFTLARQTSDTSQGGFLSVLAGLSNDKGEPNISALMRTLTGILFKLLGPGGLDLPTVIRGTTGLLSYLLSNGKNFGIVLGEYVGTAVDGLSGGGAEKNGQFFGNLLGTVLADLSADPKNNDGPPRPDIFVKTLFESFQNVKRRSDEEMISVHKNADSTDFISHIVKAVTGGVTSFIVNTFFGIIAGLSKGLASVSDPSIYSR